MKPFRLTLIILSFLALTVLAAAFVAMVSVPVVAQEPPDRPNPPSERPTPPPDRPSPPPAVGPAGTTASDGNDRAGSDACLTVRGVVTNLGYRPEPKAPVALTGADWQSHKLTDDNGLYASDCLGVGKALVNVVTPPGLHPLTTDVALRLGYRENYEVNLGLYSGPAAPPLPLPALSVSQPYVAPDELLTYTIRTTANSAGEMMITDWLPEVLTVMTVSVSSTYGQSELWDNLVTADSGELTAGQPVTVTIVAAVNAEIPPGTIIINRASQLTAGQLTVQTAPVTVTVTAAPLFDGPAITSTHQLEPPSTLPETGMAATGSLAD